MTADAFADIRGAIRRRFGEAAVVENIVVPTLGGSNRTVLFDLVEGQSRRRLASRQETSAGEGNPFLAPADQFRTMQIAFARGVPVPEPVFAFDAADAMGEGFVTAFVAGETMPKRILQEPALGLARTAMASQFGSLLALLHSIDVESVAFLERYPDSQDPIAAYRARLDTYGEPHPAIELGLRWLERHRAPVPRRALLHGDFRLGNLIVGNTGVQAVLDWECAHIGAPAEDLGWLCTRSWRFGRIDRPAGGLAGREAVLAAYAAAGGVPMVADEVRYWEIFGLVRWAILNVWQAYGHVVGGRRSPAFAACGRNTSLIEYDLMMTLGGRYD
jgi:aminoglycoside phosphotransferase (APT) family kinase protein